MLRSALPIIVAIKSREHAGIADTVPLNFKSLFTDRKSSLALILHAVVLAAPLLGGFFLKGATTVILPQDD
jgi:hypothetical protein